MQQSNSIHIEAVRTLNMPYGESESTIVQSILGCPPPELGQILDKGIILDDNITLTDDDTTLNEDIIFDNDQIQGDNIIQGANEGILDDIILDSMTTSPILPRQGDYTGVKRAVMF